MVPRVSLYANAVTNYPTFADATEVRSDPLALRALADAHGHLLFRRLLSSAVIAPLRDIALGAALELGLIRETEEARLNEETMQNWQGYADPKWLALQQIVLASEEARLLPTQPELVGIFETLFNAPVMTHRGDICRLGVPERLAPEHTTAPHQDHFYLGGSTQLWTAWTPLMPCPLALGPLALIDASHHAGSIAHEGEGIDKRELQSPEAPLWSSQALEVGDVVIFHCMCVHRALPNSTEDQLRISMDMRFQPHDDTIDITRDDSPP